MGNPSLPENPYYEIQEKLKNFEKYTTYPLTMFEDRVVENPWTFLEKPTGEKVEENGNLYDVVYHQHHEGDVIMEGTDLSAQNLGNMDFHIAILYEWLGWLIQMMRKIWLKADSFELNQMNGLIANAYQVVFFDVKPEEIMVIRGYYDKGAGEVWS